MTAIISAPTRRSLILLVLTGILISCPAAFAVTRYVAPISSSCNPSTRGSGIISDPWTNLYYTLTQGNLQPGDILQLRAGTYQNTYTNFVDECGSTGRTGIHTVMPLIIAGTQANPIIIENYPGETVIIDGTDAEMNTATWTQCGTNGWQTTAFNVGSANTAQIWVNPSGPGEPGTRLRWNSSGSCSSLSAGEFTSSGGTTISIRLSDNSNANNADIHMSCQSGDCGAYPVHATTGAGWITVRKNQAGGDFFVKYGYYNVFVDGNAQNLTFDGVQFVAGGGRDYGYCFRIWNGGYITVKNGLCRETMGEGIGFYGGGPGGGGAAGIQINNNTVENMDVYDTGRGWVDGGGNGNNLGMSIILKNCNNCVARGNRVRNSYATAISVTTSETAGMQSNNVIVEQNTIWNYGYLNLAFGGRTTAGIQIQPQVNNGIAGGTIRNNVLYNGMATHSNWDEGVHVSAAGYTSVSGLIIVNNSFSNLGGPAINLRENPAAATIRNNAMSNVSTKGATCGGGARCNLYVDSSSHTHSNNSFWSTNSADVVVSVAGVATYTRTTVTNYEPSARQADPLYLSASDLRLQPASLLIDAGTNTNCPSVDRNGVARPLNVRCDIGSFEIPLTGLAAPKNLKIP